MAGSDITTDLPVSSAELLQSTWADDAGAGRTTANDIAATSANQLVGRHNFHAMLDSKLHKIQKPFDLVLSF